MCPTLQGAESRGQDYAYKNSHFLAVVTPDVIIFYFIILSLRFFLNIPLSEQPG